jgi:hypothetical protein
MTTSDENIRDNTQKNKPRDDNTSDDNTPDDNIPDVPWGVVIWCCHLKSSSEVTRPHFIYLLNTPDDKTPDDNTPDDNTPDDNTSRRQHPR